MTPSSAGAPFWARATRSAHVLREGFPPSTGHFEREGQSRRQPKGRENSKRINLAPRVGFEPTSLWLTAGWKQSFGQPAPLQSRTPLACATNPSQQPAGCRRQLLRMARLHRHANIALTCQRKPLPLVARSPDRAYVDSYTYRSLPLNAGAPSRFEPRRPQEETEGSGSFANLVTSITALRTAVKKGNEESASYVAKN